MANKLIKSLTIDGTKRVIDAFDWTVVDGGWVSKALPANTNTDYNSILINKAGTYLVQFYAVFAYGSVTNTYDILETTLLKNGTPINKNSQSAPNTTWNTIETNQVAVVSESDLPCTLSSRLRSTQSRSAETKALVKAYQISSWDGTDYE